jgi:peptide/nickel transport system substrate-binding protein
MKKYLLAIVIVCFLIPGLVLGAPKGKLVIAQGTELTSLDPALHGTTSEFNYDHAVFDKLYLFDVDGNPVPRVAVSHKIINPTTWEFKLRKGIKFHNGDPVTAADVKFSVEHYLDPKTKAPLASFYKIVKEIKAVDEHTIQVTTDKPDPLLQKRFAFSIFILPSKYIKEKGYDTFLKRPIGCGPFKFVEWVRADRLVLEAYEDYWAGSPLIKTVVFRAIPEDTTRLAELQTGMADIILNIPPFLVNQVKGQPGIDVQSVPSGRVILLYINTLAPGPLQDKRVRQALNYAVDKKTIIDKVLMGSGFQMAINIPPYDFGYDPTLKPYPYDPEKAKKLLAEAGHKDLKLVLNSPSGRYVMDKQVAEAIAGMYEKAGIKVDFRMREWGDYVKDLFGKKLVDTGLIGSGLVMYDADGRLSLYFLRDSVFCYYVNAEIEKWILEARVSMDEKKRKELYSKISNKIFEEAPFVFLYQQQDHWGVSKKVKGFQARGDEQFFLYRVSVEK